MKEFSLLWFIENYSYCWHETGVPLYSPKFSLDELERTSWYLWLYPRGKTGDETPIYLGRAKDDAGPENILLKFEISVLAEDGSTLQSKRKKLAFKKGIGLQIGLMLLLKEVLIRRNTEYLPRDTLSVRCKIWYGEGSIQTAAQSSARTRMGIKKISFLHKVANFSHLYPDVKDTLQIQSQSTTKCVISSRQYFTVNGTMIVETVSSDKNHTLIMQKISLLDESGKVIECFKVDNRFEIFIKPIKISSLSLSRKAIVDKKEEYLPNDELSLLCECHFSTGIEISKIEEVQYYTPIMTTLKPRLDAVSSKEENFISRKLSLCPGALQDLKRIYSNQILTDVKLKTKEKSFPAHKLVLSARSSVFEAMLTSDMREKNTSCIQVDDLDDDTVQQLLLFLYIDNIENLQWNTAIKLYYAGDKYAVEKLKLISSSYLVQNLSTYTAIELLILADMHNDSDLKNFVEDFILQHKELIIELDEWKNLEKTHPQLVMSLMYLMIKGKK